MKSNSSTPLGHQAKAGETQGFENESSLLEKSSFYREFSAEREEVLKHKWIESEKAGRDIGFDYALVNWMVHHRSHWRKARQSQ